MSFTAIAKQLRDERLADAHVLAERAKAEYGDSFNETFSYRRGSQRFTMTKPAMIAKRFRELCGERPSDDSP